MEESLFWLMTSRRVKVHRGEEAWQPVADMAAREQEAESSHLQTPASQNRESKPEGGAGLSAQSQPRDAVPPPRLHFLSLP